MSNEHLNPKKNPTKVDVTFFRPQADLHIYHGNLPHWRQDRVTYFITTRLADSMPLEKLQEWRKKRDAWLAIRGIMSPTDIHLLLEDQQHEFHSRFTNEWHKWLDAGFGECHLRRSDVREILVKRLTCESSLDAWVIMPNHLHAILSPQENTLGAVMKNWKGGSAFEINRLLGRSGALWQKESFDHIVRSEAQWQHYRRYIAENPVTAKLRKDEYSLGIGREIC